MKRTSGKPSRSKQASALFAEQLLERGLPEAESEFYFAKELGRRWRFDFAWPEQLVAVEIEGLVVYRGWVAKLDGKDPVYEAGRVTNVLEVQSQLLVMGAHATITGFREDCEKYAWAAALGWRVLRFEQSQIRDKFAIEMAVRVLAGAAPTKQTACAAKPDKRRGAGVTKPLDFGAPF